MQTLFHQWSYAVYPPVVKWKFITKLIVGCYDMSFVLLQGRGQQEWCEYKPSTIFLNTIYEIFDLKYFDYALNKEF